MNTFDYTKAAWDAWLSSPPPPAYRVGDTIVCPGYHSPQGDSMSLFGCGDSTCKACYPQPSSPLGYATLGYSSSTWQSSPIKIELDNKILADMFGDASRWKLNFGPSKEQSMSNKAQQALEAVRGLDESELPAISQEVETIKRKNKERIVKSLQGVADLAKMEKPQGSQFVIAYYRSGKAKTLQGVDYAKDEYISEKDESNENRVYVHGSDYPVSGAASSMNALKKSLDKREIPYVIAYFD